MRTSITPIPFNNRLKEDDKARQTDSAMGEELEAQRVRGVHIRPQQLSYHFVAASASASALALVSELILP
eukprot:COSAG06_NODE_854_length_11931_cov_55.985970_10_plen_70_part_00